ncbi:MAG: phosphoglucomutase/phosphomannomutase family protein [Elusimicrobia bacterium]|nr:phosphoglucomutase/phosphomannomutase family protein [Elusimicrobiota bacterium]
MAGAHIKFGTSGWRAVIAEDFTLTNLRRVTHAAAKHIRENREYGCKGEEYLLHLKTSGKPPPKVPQVAIGYDTRCLSEEFAKNVAEAFAVEGFCALLSDAEAPTPVTAWTVTNTHAAGGVMITAGHHPPHYNGFKWTPYWGGPAMPAVTDDLEARAQSLTIAESDKFTPFEQGVSAGLIKMTDFHPDYFKQLFSLLDEKAIKKAGLKIAADSVHGAVRTYLRPALERLGAQVTGLRERRDVMFGGRSPDTDEENLKLLKETVVANKLDLGLACDGDGDRFGVIDSDGAWISPNQVLGLALEHLVKNRGLKGKLARSVMTSHFADSIARHYGLEVRETAVGFKHIGNLLRTGRYLLGGEESGGLSIMGHVPEKDGILACLLMAELAAYERKPIKKILGGLNKKVGNFVNARINLRLDKSMNMAAVIEKLQHRPPLNLAGSSVWRIDHTDGFKFIMKDGSWLGLRPSGTEPVVRIYAEAASPSKMNSLMDSGKKILGGKL